MTNKSLKNLNSLKFDYSCKSFIEITCYEDLFQLSKKIRESKTKYWILGEGTNVVILNDLEGLVIKNKLLGVTYNNNSVESASGENWDDLVKDCLQKKLYGFENLSGIPGSVGGSPIQNIGAYGVEVSNFIDYVETVNLDTGNLEIFNFVSLENTSSILYGSVLKLLQISPTSLAKDTFKACQLFEMHFINSDSLIGMKIIFSSISL